MSAIRRNSVVAASVALLGALLLGGCSTTTSSAPPDTQPVQFVGTQTTQSKATSSTAAAKVQSGHAIITLSDSGATPVASTVKVGTRVVWTNAGNIPHSIAIQGGPKSPAIKVAGTASHIFKVPGTFVFADPAHPEVRGTITVTK